MILRSHVLAVIANYPPRPKKKMFVSCNSPKKNRVGRSVKKNWGGLFFWSKMCVLCMFYVDWELGVQKKL